MGVVKIQKNWEGVVERQIDGCVQENLEGVFRRQLGECN